MLLLVLVLIVALGVGCIVSAVRLWRRPQGGHVAVRGVASVIALLGLWLTLMGVGLFLNRSSGRESIALTVRAVPPVPGPKR